MSLSQIRYFVAVAEEGNVGRAAKRLRVAQPPLSRQIRALEDEIGTPLFTRTPRGMTLLPPGRVLLDHARAILSAIDRAVDATRAGGTDGPRDVPVDRPTRREEDGEEHRHPRAHHALEVLVPPPRGPDLESSSRSTSGCATVDDAT